MPHGHAHVNQCFSFSIAINVIRGVFQLDRIALISGGGKRQVTLLDIWLTNEPHTTPGIFLVHFFICICAQIWLAKINMLQNFTHTKKLDFPHIEEDLKAEWSQGICVLRNKVRIFQSWISLDNISLG